MRMVTWSGRKLGTQVQTGGWLCLLCSPALPWWPGAGEKRPLQTLVHRRSDFERFRLTSGGYYPCLCPHPALSHVSCCSGLSVVCSHTVSTFSLVTLSTPARAGLNSWHQPPRRLTYSSALMSWLCLLLPEISFPTKLPLTSGFLSSGSSICSRSSHFLGFLA